MTKREWITELTRLGACADAIAWVEAHQSDDPAEIWRSCENAEWLIMIAARYNPIAVAHFALSCAGRADDYAVVDGAPDIRIMARDALSAAARGAIWETVRIACDIAGYTVDAAAESAADGEEVEEAEARERAAQLADARRLWWVTE